ERRRLRVLVLVDHVLVERLGDQPGGLRLHPRGDERRHVQPGVAVERELVVDDLVRRVGVHGRVRHAVPRDAVELAETRALRADREGVVRALVGFMRASDHWFLSLLSGAARYAATRAGGMGVNECSSSCPGWTTP